MSQQIYSLPRLAASVPLRSKSAHASLASGLPSQSLRGRGTHTTLFRLTRVTLTNPSPAAMSARFAGGAGEGTRTLNLRITNPPLYQLSYASGERRRRERYGATPLASKPLRQAVPATPRGWAATRPAQAASKSASAPAVATLSEPTAPLHRDREAVVREPPDAVAEPRPFARRRRARGRPARPDPGCRRGSRGDSGSSATHPEPRLLRAPRARARGSRRERPGRCSSAPALARRDRARRAAAHGARSRWRPSPPPPPRPGAARRRSAGPRPRRARRAGGDPARPARGARRARPPAAGPPRARAPACGRPARGGSSASAEASTTGTPASRASFAQLGELGRGGARARTWRRTHRAGARRGAPRGPGGSRRPGSASTDRDDGGSDGLRRPAAPDAGRISPRRLRRGAARAAPEDAGPGPRSPGWFLSSNSR